MDARRANLPSATNREPKGERLPVLFLREAHSRLSGPFAASLPSGFFCPVFLKGRRPPSTGHGRGFRASGRERLGISTKLQFPRQVRGNRHTEMALRALPDLR